MHSLDHLLRPYDMPGMAAILTERRRQEERFGTQHRTAADWHQIITALNGELARACLAGDPAAAERATIQIAATAAAALQDFEIEP